MAARILRGAPVAEVIHRELMPDIEALAARSIRPCLAVLRVGENPGDIAYERGLLKKASALHIDVKSVALPASVSQETLAAEIDALNASAGVHGILVFRPLPPHIDGGFLRAGIAGEKDIDGVTNVSLAGVFAGDGAGRGFPPCTARACVEVLDRCGVSCEGRRAVVIGRSLVAGKPAAMLLLARNSTVTLCHRKTPNLAAVCREADILVAAAGCPGLVTGDFLSAGQTVIDVGINVNACGVISGDVDFEAAASIVNAVTPVPGGVGTVTSSVLLRHVVEAAARQTGAA